MLAAFVFSGIAALIYEITWIRPLQFLLGSTIYTISIIFAVFMFGVGLGALIISKYIENIKNLPATYAIFELCIGLYGVLLLSIFNILPEIYNLIYSIHINFYVFEIVQFLLVFIVLLIPTTLMGATFPVIAKFYTKEKIGRGIGEVYSGNNLGAIIGSFSAGFILIPLVGIKTSIVLAGSINLFLGFVILFYTTKEEIYQKIIPAVFIVFLILSYFGNYNIQQMHSGGFYRIEKVYEDIGPVVYYKEGIYATISVRDLFGKGKVLLINGYGQGGTEILDLRVNFLLSYLPLLINPESNNSLVIGLGTGTTSGQLAQNIKVKTVEIEPVISETIPYFNSFNMKVLNNPNHELIIDDARNYLLKNNEKYDLIIAEPTNTWQSFSTQLYSKEFLELVKDDLNDDGLFVKWVPIYTMSPSDFKNFYKTFSSVFHNNVAFANIKSDENTPVKFETSEIILIGSKKDIKINQSDIESNYKFLPKMSKQQLGLIKLESGREVTHLFLFDDEMMKDYADDAKILTDDNPILEFSTAKRALNQNPKEIIEDIKKFIENA